MFVGSFAMAVPNCHKIGKFCIFVRDESRVWLALDLDATVLCSVLIREIIS